MKLTGVEGFEQAGQGDKGCGTAGEGLREWEGGRWIWKESGGGAVMKVAKGPVGVHGCSISGGEHQGVAGWEAVCYASWLMRVLGIAGWAWGLRGRRGRRRLVQ